MEAQPDQPPDPRGRRLLRPAPVPPAALRLLASRPLAKWAAGAAEIRRAGLGWDITDFGSGDFTAKGLTLFTVRNGTPNDPAGKTYCEKIMMVRENQVTPLHFHFAKMEDIINRGGGKLAIRFFWADPAETIDRTRLVEISTESC